MRGGTHNQRRCIAQGPELARNWAQDTNRTGLCPILCLGARQCLIGSTLFPIPDIVSLYSKNRMDNEIDIYNIINHMEITSPMCLKCQSVWPVGVLRLVLATLAQLCRALGTRSFHPIHPVYPSSGPTQQLSGHMSLYYRTHSTPSGRTIQRITSLIFVVI